VDVSDEEERSKLVGIVWSMLMVGIVIGAIVSSRLLDSPTICGAAVLARESASPVSSAHIPRLRATIDPVFTLMPAIVFGLCILSTFGIEKKYSRFATRSLSVDREDRITLQHALRVLTSSRQTGFFFAFLLVMTLSLFMQDAVMEPFGGEVFGMCIAETTRLNAFWGTGTLLGIATTGFFLVPRVGKQRTTKIGCIFAAICLIGLIVAGLTADRDLLRSGLLFFGLASGTITAGATSLMLDLTAAETAGTFIGAWGLSQAIARGAATVLGGAALSIGKVVFPLPALSYGLVFFLQALGMLAAVRLLGLVDIKEFRDNARAAIATALRGEID
jgi:BCD family chlorophyll transporter-like MFS transporter